MNAILAIFVCAFITEINLAVALMRRPTCPMLRIPNGRVRYRQKSGFAQLVCNKSYTLAGDRYMKCVLGEWEGEIPVCVKNTCKTVGMPKFGFVYPAHRGGVLNFYCMGGYELNGPATLYCDGKKWNSYLPTCIASSRKVSLNCDFEHEDLCGWTHDINHDFNWIRLKNSTPSWHVGTGPSYDHTLGRNGEGYYMYIESTSQKLNDTARLISPVYKYQENETCLEFYYHMHGTTMGELRVYLKKVKDSWDLNPEDAVFSISGNQGNEWKRSLLNLGRIEDNFQIVMEGVRGSSYLSDIAIDDVRVIENCAEEMEESTTSSSTTDVTEENYTFGSCSSRCGLRSWNISHCDCHDGCFASGTCCADYIPSCFFTNMGFDETEEDGSSTVTEYETTETTTEAGEETTTIESTSTEPITVTEMEAITVPKYKIKIPLQRKVFPTPPGRTFNYGTTILWKETLTPARKQVFVNTTIVKPKPKTVEVKRINTTKAPVVVTSKPRIFTKKASTVKPLVPSKKVNITRNRIIPNYKKSYLKNKTFKEKENDYYKQDMLTLAPPEKEDEELVEILTTENTLKLALLKTGKKVNVVEEVGQKTDSKSVSHLLIFVAVGVGFLVVVIGTMCVVRRRRAGCRSIRRRNGSYGDSASDVRFLTSDEVLDFRLATPY